MPTINSYLPTLRAGRWFVQRPEVFSNALLNMAKLRRMQTGDALFLRGDPPCGLYALLRGSIRISGLVDTHGDTREALLILLTPPTWFGEISVFDGSTRTHDAYAAERSTLLHIPHDALNAWLQIYPQYWRDLALLMADKIRLALNNIEEQAVLPASVRITRRLVQMAHSYGQAANNGSTYRTLAITQEQLALMVGVSRQTTNQILNNLRDLHLIRVHRGALEILDLPALRRLQVPTTLAPQ
jgi:CRP/FNR family transcriptional regulator, cyclic AMP receptor protein